jgi:CRISPR-associated endonuclease/helicase Cas3
MAPLEESEFMEMKPAFCCANALETAFFRYWAKAWRTDQPHLYHPLPYHSLDVGACVAALIEANPKLGQILARLLGGGATPEMATRLAVLMALLHDIGKFARSFQSLSPEACAALGIPCDRALASLYDKRGGLGHDAFGGWIWLDKDLAAELLGAAMADNVAAARLIGSAAFGHHGAPPKDHVPREQRTTMRRSFPAADLDAAKAFATVCRELIMDGPVALPAGEEEAKRASLLLAAIVNVADWLGSSTTYFRYRAPDLSIAQYWHGHGTWKGALAVARRIVSDSGLVPAPPTPVGSFSAIFPSYTPSPLQHLLDTMELPPQFLLIVEEIAGGGKTEAALTVAARAIAQGSARGLFFGLPTMATADAQARRQAEIYRSLFADGNGASMTVAHSLAGLGALASAGVDCADWIADDRRRRLMADVCVGTVDQALLAAIPARFAAIRIFGLFGKLIVLDEVHAFDGYTSALIEGLLALHAALGGSAILLSATLTVETKGRLARAFAASVAFPMPDDGAIGDLRYPLVTLVGPRGVVTKMPDPAPNAPPDKDIRFVRSVEQAEAEVLAAARAGRCVLWIRNTVDQVIETGRSLAALHPDVMVYHSRFPERDREAWRRIVMRRFGKLSDYRRRHGAIVVATAIAEQSLDIDFDLVVIDLKPMDSLIQGLGRGRRHPRDDLGRLLKVGRDQRPPVPMIVISPDPDMVTDASWYSALLGEASFVHRDPALLWRTAAALARAGGVRYGQETRRLIEVAFADSPTLTAPEVLTKAAAAAEDDENQGYASGVRLTSKFGVATGFVHVEEAWDDARIPTRRGDAVEVVLVRRCTDGRLRPYRGQDWASGRLRVPARRVHNWDPLADDEKAMMRRLCPHTIPVEIVKRGGVWKHEAGTLPAFEASRRLGLLWQRDDREGG